MVKDKIHGTIEGREIPLKMDIPKSSNAQCDLTDCDRRAVYYPIVKVWAKLARKHKPAEILMPGLVCAKCAGKLDAQDFITQKGWREITEEFQKKGGLMPDSKSVELQFKVIK